MTGKEAVLQAFDRLFDKAAAKLRIECNDEEKEEAKRHFAARFSAALDVAGEVTIPEIPEDVMRGMEEAIDHLSPAHLHELVPDIGERDVYVCGPPGLIDIVTRHVREAGVRRRQIHAERFAL